MTRAPASELRSVRISDGSSRTDASAASAELADYIDHRFVQVAVCRKDVSRTGDERLAVGVGDASTRLGHDQRASGDVPRLEVCLPERVHPSRGHVAEIDRRRPEAAHRSRAADKLAEQADDLVD